MNRIRLLPVVVLAVAALLVLKTLGLVTNGGYVLVGTTPVVAAGDGGGHSAPAAGPDAATMEPDSTLTLPGEPTLQDSAPTLADTAPTMDSGAGANTHGASTAASHSTAVDDPAPAGESSTGEPAPATPSAPPSPVAASSVYCREAHVTLTESGLPMAAPGGEGASAEGDHGGGEAPADESAEVVPPLLTTDCLPSGDAVPLQVNSDGSLQPLLAGTGTSVTEQQIFERLAARRAELEKYEQDLTLRSALVDAAEKRIEERATTLEALEAQIAGLVDQREEMESGQFASIVAMYQAMKPKDAAKIFNNLDMDVMLRVAKAMDPRKMAPVLAEMDPTRAQELTVRMASAADQPVTQITPDALASLPQIVGQ